MRSLGVAACALLLATTLAAQRGAAPQRPATPGARPAGTLAQVMRGIYFPNPNISFDVQHADPGAPKPAAGAGGGAATSAYANTYSGWEAVENAAIALTDGVDLILKPGRLCQNGKPVPLQQADFQT